MSINVIVEPKANLEVRVDRGIGGPTGPAGVAGPTGPTGPQGTGINIKGAVATVQDLPTTGNQPGDAYIVTSTGELYVWED